MALLSSYFQKKYNLNRQSRKKIHFGTFLFLKMTEKMECKASQCIMGQKTWISELIGAKIVLYYTSLLSFYLCRIKRKNNSCDRQLQDLANLDCPISEPFLGLLFNLWSRRWGCCTQGRRQKNFQWETTKKTSIKGVLNLNFGPFSFELKKCFRVLWPRKTEDIWIFSP